jgi:hypothetical protein
MHNPHEPIQRRPARIDTIFVHSTLKLALHVRVHHSWLHSSPHPPDTALTLAEPKETWQVKVARTQIDLCEKVPDAWRVPDAVTSHISFTLEDYPNRLIKDEVVRQMGILIDKEIGVTQDYTAVELVQSLPGDELTAAEVVTSFSERASIAG